MVSPEKSPSITGTRSLTLTPRFWWLDLNTLIMEPRLSLQEHIFNNLANNTYRDINVYNPLKIQHPPPENEFFFLDSISKSPVGDEKEESINLIVPQDCGGFNLGSFFIKRSEWSERLLDIWWDPVGYEQKHMEWEHKEQDALVSFCLLNPIPPPHRASARGEERGPESILARMAAKELRSGADVMISSRSTSTATSPGCVRAQPSFHNGKSTPFPPELVQRLRTIRIFSIPRRIGTLW